MVRSAILAGAVAVLALLGGAWALSADETASRAVPEAFAPFEHMIGSWKGTAIPAANRFKGWQETHMWAWKFLKGEPVGMTLELKGDKALTKGQLSHDEAAKKYRLDATDAAGKPIVYVGGMDKTGKALVLDRVEPAGNGKDRITIRPNANMIRYTMDFEHQDADSPQFKKATEIGLTKEGESFAGGTAADLPKCIITGGAASMSVSYQGKTYPLCCSGCRDEFNDNPEKYVKKASLMTGAGAGGKTPVKAATSSVGKDDGSFGDVGAEKPKAKATATRPAPKAKADPAEAEGPAAATTKPAPATETSAAKGAKAASLLRLGQNLEKTGKPAAALTYYRQIVKDYADTPSAKTAAARVKALATP